MLAFASCAPFRGQFINSHYITTRVCAQFTVHKRHRHLVPCMISRATEETDDEQVYTPDIDYDSMESDETHIVLDQKSISALIGELQEQGKDNFGTENDENSSYTEEFLNFAENRIDELSSHTTTTTTSSVKFSGTTERKIEDLQVNSESDQSMNDGIFSDMPDSYLSNEYLEFMPSWAKEAYKDGTHKQLEEGGRRLSPSERAQRLHDIVAHSTENVKGLRKVPVEGEGIFDCNVGDVAEDYSVPIEFVVDAMISYGVQMPVEIDTGIRDSMTTDEIYRLLKLITSFDAQDLSDRYSDRTIEELAEDYDLPPSKIIEVCEEEALYICNGEQTRLSVVREDRVLDIILNDGKRGEPYPPLLEGLE